jgi:osmoprotectant transport system substrate-binding protein
MFTGAIAAFYSASRRKPGRWIWVAIAAVTVTALAAADVGHAASPVVVASKIDTEGALLGNMIAEMIESRGIPVERRIQLGPTNILRAALLAGQIDLYPEYTGNGALFFHREADPAWKNADVGYGLVKTLDREQNHVVWLTPAPANNTWVIAVRGDIPGFANGHCLDDLVAHLKSGGPFKLAASAEFVESPAALPAFEKTYGFHLRSEQLLTLSGGNTAATLRAAGENISGVNAAMAYGTDGEIAALGLKALCDDKGAQIVYAPAPVIRAPVLESNPQIAQALEPVFTSLSLATLQQLNARIAVEGEDAGAVARDYLKTKHFLE